MPRYNWYFQRKSEICLDWALPSSNGKRKEEAHISQFFLPLSNIIFLFVIFTTSPRLNILRYRACKETSHRSSPRYILRPTEKLSKGGLRCQWLERCFLIGVVEVPTLRTWRGSFNDKSGACPENVSCFAIITQQWWRFDLLRMSKDNCEHEFTRTLRQELLFTRLKNFGPFC